MRRNDKSAAFELTVFVGNDSAKGKSDRIAPTLPLGVAEPQIVFSLAVFVSVNLVADDGKRAVIQL